MSLFGIAVYKLGFVFEYIIFVCCKGLHSRTACSTAIAAA